MKYAKLLLSVLVLGITSFVHGADIPWDGTYDIPNDGNTYYVDTTVTIGDVSVSRSIHGLLEIRTEGTLNLNRLTHFTVESSATVSICGGTINLKRNWYHDGMLVITEGYLRMLYSDLGAVFFNGYNSNGTVQILGGTLDLTSGSFVNSPNGPNGIITLSGGTINLSGGTYTNYDGGTTTISSGTFIYGGTNVNINGGTFTLFGTSVSSPTSLYLSGTMNIPAGSTFQVDPEGSVYQGSNDFINVYGTFLVKGSFYNGEGSGAGGAVTVYPGGILQLDGEGEFYNAYSGYSVGAITIIGGALIISGGELYVEYGESSEGSVSIPYGTFKYLDGEVELDGGNFSLFGTNVSFDEDKLVVEGTLSIPEGSVLVAGPGGMSNNTPVTINISGKMHISNTFYNGETTAGTININPGGILSMDNSSILYNGWDGNAGVINIGFDGTLLQASGTIINNDGSSEINVNSGGKWYSYYGTIDLSDGDVDIKQGGIFDYVRGVIQFDGGDLNFAEGCLFTDGDDVVLKEDLDIDFTWTITGNGIINGQGHKIVLGPNGAIVVDVNASLLLEDIIIENLSENKIRCFDNTATLSLHNAKLVQDADYSFTTGTLVLYDGVTVEGGAVFSFESTQSAMVQSGATVAFGSGTTLQYNAATPNLWQFADTTARLVLTHSVLLASTSWNLTTGKMTTNGDVTLQGDAALSLSGLSSFDINGSIRRIGTVTI